MKIISNTQNLIHYKVLLQVEEAVHKFMKKKGFLRVDLPVLSPSLIPESYLEVFETEYRYLDKRQKLYLTPSPELFMKRLLSEGIGNIYYLGKAFRNSEPSSSLHSSEFTILEFYKINADYLDLAKEVLELLQFILNSLRRHSGESRFDRGDFGQARVTIQNQTSFSKWEKFTVAEAFEKFAGISEKELFDKKTFINKAKEKGYRVSGFSYEDIWSQIYTAEVEQKLGTRGFPTLIYDYPKEFAALAKLNPDDRTAQRFEFYIQGVELGDCYTELSDWKQQQSRFKQEADKRKKMKKINHPIDKGMTTALKYGLPDCAGIAIGLERLAMIFANVQSIQQIKLITVET
ncbi:hypothetical protein A2774_02385 [Candidatus Roizmanbacteria bacterium RIFCSPHIGHO2_01_FULL_39_12c]|uniref:Aminoacyl-transfer RNA synthetases class-II family profile domain-containing protein n=1 Tax=Candidatus Roizmanbacteria bacterium RIFCSPHIGHO2_01_FULL_39_12c TaxID=1802031 RepID=A0A1F7GED6_9BACT|nr:MAG: hypothetical protein A2774_02385 [Candidatus Roizmanbacteria bacterium RIFCSPHIGHO2_01_FULL_39_12c]OGK47613.1 MAG: hypothetical protein A2963_01105 [Candidatus Roizmanbacteria bacterium RIFCSPLOWO2_01_FULL_40_13]